MVDFKQLNKMCPWERKKAMYLIDVAQNLDMDIEGYGELGVNPNSGYTYLWLDDYPFTLCLPIHCELQTEDVCALWIDPCCGHEVERKLGDSTLQELNSWSDECLRDAIEQADGDKKR